MTQSRVKNTYRNSIVGISSQMISAILSFVSRTIFINTLGVDYLGIGGLFSNVLIMLSLTDLGIYTVMVYSLYKPLAEQDKHTVSVYVHYFQHLYNIIAVCVLGIGLFLIPFLPMLVNGSEIENGALIKYYLILLLNSVVSYFAISRATLFRADQKVYIVRLVTTISNVLLHVIQIIVLILFHDYTVYLICQVCFTLGNNVFLSYLAIKKYPYIKKEKDKDLENDVNKQIIKNLKASFLYKVGSQVLNSTDNILISVIVGTTMVGYFNNYVTIYALVNTFIMILIEAVLASIGNYNATESTENKYKLFKSLTMTMYLIATFCVSCYIAGMEDFIRIWLGSKYIIGGGFIFALALNRFVFCLIHPLWMMRESSGVFVETKYIMLFAAIVNVILSVVLGKIIGIAGIIAATAISYLFTVYWYEPIQLQKRIFHNDLSEYWTYIMKLLLASAIPILVSYILYTYHNKSLIVLFGKFAIIGIMTLVTYYVMFHKSEEFGNVKKRILSVIHR